MKMMVTSVRLVWYTVVGKLAENVEENPGIGTRGRKMLETCPNETFFICTDRKKKLVCFRGSSINFLGCCTVGRRSEGEAARGRSVLGDHRAKLGLFCFYVAPP